MLINFILVFAKKAICQVVAYLANPGMVSSVSGTTGGGLLGSFVCPGFRGGRGIVGKTLASFFGKLCKFCIQLLIAS